MPSREGGMGMNQMNSGGGGAQFGGQPSVSGGGGDH